MSRTNELKMVSSAYFLKGVVDDLLAVSIWNSWEKISEDGVSLLVNLPLGARYRLWLSGFVHVGGLVIVASLVQSLASLVYDRMSKMIS